jgi:hypothetical protein
MYLACTSQPPPNHMACTWLEGGFGVAWELICTPYRSGCRGGSLGSVAGTNLVLLDSTATNAQRFYRVRRW